MNPYEADPSKIPPTDLYADVPHYGRYLPHESDFHPDPAHINKHTPEAIAYWKSVLTKCDKSTCLYDGEVGGRSVFAIGGVIVKTAHTQAQPEARDYSYTDKNEEAAIQKFRSSSLDQSGVQVPRIYFCGKIDGHQVLIQSRIPGVGLNVAWPYLSAAQKASFKRQAREFLQRLHAVPPPPCVAAPAMVAPDADPVAHRGIQALEYQLLYESGTDDRGFMHNDLQPSNVIVDADRIVGVIDWEMAGWWGWRRAAEVHVRIRMPAEDTWEGCGLDRETVADLLYWNDLYETPVAC
ncbi:kinase-like domain-containing protein [Geopyxis carbonaria]|nr:kinase-like domain-containing protein [Geopyxis carbonaria]